MAGHQTKHFVVKRDTLLLNHSGNAAGGEPNEDVIRYLFTGGGGGNPHHYRMARPQK